MVGGAAEPFGNVDLAGVRPLPVGGLPRDIHSAERMPWTVAAGNLARNSKRPKAWANLSQVSTVPAVRLVVKSPNGLEQVKDSASTRAVSFTVPLATETLSGSST